MPRKKSPIIWALLGGKGIKDGGKIRKYTYIDRQCTGLIPNDSHLPKLSYLFFTLLLKNLFQV
jgi:hypothetical protein